MPLDLARGIPASRRIKRAMPSSLDLLFDDPRAKTVCGLCHGTPGAHRPARRDCHRRESRGVHDGRSAEFRLKHTYTSFLSGQVSKMRRGPGLQRLAVVARRRLCDVAVNPYIPP